MAKQNEGMARKRTPHFVVIVHHPMGWRIKLWFTEMFFCRQFWRLGGSSYLFNLFENDWAPDMAARTLRTLPRHTREKGAAGCSFSHKDSPARHP
jgi:hypothetical protein